MSKHVERPLAVSNPIAAWRMFWFEPTDMTTLGLVRIAFGLVAIGWTFSLLPDLQDLFGPRGVQSASLPGIGRWTVLDLVGNEHAVVVLWWVLLAGGVEAAPSRTPDHQCCPATWA